MNRYGNICVTLIFSVLLHLGVLYLSPFNISADVPDKKELRVAFKIEKPGKQKVRPVKKKVAAREPRRLVEKVKPVRKKSPILKPEKIVKKVPLPKIEPDPPKVKEEIQRVEQQIVKTEKQAPIRPEPPAPEPVTDSSEEERYSFNELVFSKIEKEKVYPRIARRMGIQGDVLVAFTILPNGSVCDIKILSGIKSHKLLRKAAVSTIEKAAPYLPFPLSLRKDVGLRMKIKMAYEIT